MATTDERDAAARVTPAGESGSDDHEPDDRPQRRREWSGGLRSVVVPLLAVAAIVGAVWFLQRGRDDSGARGDGLGIVELPAAKNPTGRPPVAEEGRAAPDFALRTLDGATIRLSDLRGRTVLLNFWATWCGPCRQEVPELVRAYSANKPKGLEIIAIDVKEPEAQVRPFVEEFGMNFPVVIDTDGGVSTVYQVGTGLPVSVFIDGSGVIRTIKLGAMSENYLKTRLEALMPQQ